jgi:hypothetical protein
MSTKRLNDQPKKNIPPPFTQKKGGYAENWDDPNVQLKRVLTKAQQPAWIDKGPPGLLGRTRPDA